MSCCSRSRNLLPVKQDLFNLPPIAPSEFKSVIEGPAHRVVESGGRLKVEPALTEQLIADAQGADALPLLAFTLERLYADFGGDGELTLADYQKVGGVQGSIEAAIASALTEPGHTPAIPAAKDMQLAAMRAAFIPWLARIDPDSGVPMRRLARRDEIPEGSRAIVERLVEERLLVADRRSGVDVIEIAHESLLRQWPALTGWLEADAEDLKVIDVVERAAAEWARNGRHEAWLDHRAERLAAADRLALRDDFRKRLGAEGADYVAACRAREEAERKEPKRRRSRASKQGSPRSRSRRRALPACSAPRAGCWPRWRRMRCRGSRARIGGSAKGRSILRRRGRARARTDQSALRPLVGRAAAWQRRWRAAARDFERAPRSQGRAAAAATSPALAALAAAVSQVGWRSSFSAVTRTW